MPVREELRGLRRRRRPNKARKFAWRAFFILAGLFSVFFGLSLFSFYAPFQIEKVVIIGIKGFSRRAELPAEASVAHAFAEQGVRLFSFTHKFLYPRAALINEVASSSPRIASVDAMRGGGIVIIAVSERKPFAKWCPSTSSGQATKNDACVFIDENGFGFAPAKENLLSSSPITFVDEHISTSIGARYLLPEPFAQIREVISSAERVGLTVTTVARAENNDFTFSLADGAEARFVLSGETGAFFLGLPDTLAAANLKISNGSVSPPLRYVDLRFKDQVVFKRK